MRLVFKTTDRVVEPANGFADGSDVPVASTHRFRDARIAGFLAVESGHLALAQIFRQTRRDTALELVKVPVLQGMMRLVESP